MLIVLLAIVALRGNGSGATGGSVVDDPAPTVAVDFEELLDDDAVRGDKDAPVTIIEWSDFECPFCKRANDDAIAQVKSQYVNSGKVKIVYRDFPLTSIHPNAQKAAEAAECADDQGKFWEMHDIIFARQPSLSLANLKNWAVELGLDAEEFNDCLDSGKHTNEVNKDAQDAQNVGGRGTPYFVVGNTPISGAQPFANFQAAIEAQL